MQGAEAGEGQGQAQCSYGRRTPPLKRKNPLPLRSHAWVKFGSDAPPKQDPPQPPPQGAELRLPGAAAGGSEKTPCSAKSNPKKILAGANPFGLNGGSSGSEASEENRRSSKKIRLNRSRIFRGQTMSQRQSTKTMNRNTKRE